MGVMYDVVMWIINFLTKIVNMNYGLFFCIFLAAVLYKAAKTSFNIALLIVFIGIVLAIGTYMGFIPSITGFIAISQKYLT